MSASVTIPIAGFKDVYDVPAVEKALQELPPGANEALRAVYEKMLRLGGQRFTVKPSALPEMEALCEELPNFAIVLEDIRKHLALCIGSEDSVELPPMLLLGAPGIGKTHFARKIAQLLGTGFGFVPMSSLTAGWVLSGASIWYTFRRSSSGSGTRPASLAVASHTAPEASIGSSTNSSTKRVAVSISSSS